MVSHIYADLRGNTTVRLPHPRSGGSQDQGTFLAPPADKQARKYLSLSPLCSTKMSVIIFSKRHFLKDQLPFGLCLNKKCTVY